MIQFLTHVLFIFLVGWASVSVLREYERNARVAALLECSIVVSASASILHRLPPLSGGGPL